jgi:hypothetical protein
MDIQVNASEWGEINEETREKIRAIITSHFPDVNLRPNESAPSSQDAIAQRTLQPFNFKNPLCTAACGIAEASAVAACAVLSGVALAACIAAAHEAGNFCRSRC